MPRFEINVLTGEVLTLPDAPSPAPSQPEIPLSVSRRQFKRALLELDLLDIVEASIATSSDRTLQIDWAEAQYFERNNPFVFQLAQALNKSSADIDNLFLLAGSL